MNKPSKPQPLARTNRGKGSAPASNEERHGAKAAGDPGPGGESGQFGSHAPFGARREKATALASNPVDRSRGRD